MARVRLKGLVNLAEKKSFFEEKSAENLFVRKIIYLKTCLLENNVFEMLIVKKLLFF
jgi:hypothetical protein